MLTIAQLHEIFLQHPQVVTDSRKVLPGCLFFALKGENFNGNEFACQALENGAAFAVIDEPAHAVDKRCLLVENVLETLQQLATHHRRKFHIPVLAITGSNGKTTTKELISAVLGSHYPTHFTRGNFNNHIGVPLTLLAMPVGTQIAVIEMGANHQGEIGFLCQVAEPTHGLITNVGKAHLEGFGGVEGVKKGKGELYRYLAAKGGVAFVNLDEGSLVDMAQPVQWKIFYKKSELPTSGRQPFEVQMLAESPFVEVNFDCDEGYPLEIQSNLVGQYNFSNIMTAVVVGTYFKVPGAKIKAAIEAYVPANNRSQLLVLGTNTFVLDAYNANPTSMKNALLAFAKMEAAHKVAVLGAMRELGEFSEKEHRDILALAQACGLDTIALVGPEFREAAQGADVHFFEDTEKVNAWFRQQNFTETHFLVKGSRSIGLERLVENAHLNKEY